MRSRITRRNSALRCVYQCDSFTSSVLLSSLVFILVCSTLITGVGACKACDYTRFQALQTVCRDQVESLDTATGANKPKVICSSLTNVFLCGGENIPECINNLTHFYSAYLATPFDCHVSSDVIRRLQDFKRNMHCSTEPDKQTTLSATTEDKLTFTDHVTTSTYGRHVNSANTISGFSPPHLIMKYVGWTFLLIYFIYIA